jgi:Putative prokaryotic signal transducing protein
MSDTNLVVVRTFADRIEAELAHSALEAAGIESMIRADDAGGLRPAMGFSNGVALLVRAEQAEAAADVLSADQTPTHP